MKILSVFMMAAVVLMVSACAKTTAPAMSNNSTVLNTPVVNTSARNASSGNGNSTSKPLCENPIALESSDLKSLTEKADFPIGKFKLVEMHMYVTSESNGDSFTVSAEDKNAFEVKLECNGIPVPTAANSDTTRSSLFKVSDVIDTTADATPTTQRTIKVHFKNGSLTSAISEIVPMSVGNKKLDSVPKERVPVGNGFITMRIYSPTSDTMELRMKFEVPAEDGKYETSFSRAVYQKVSN